jgi:hypothetical protein
MLRAAGMVLSYTSILSFFLWYAGVAVPPVLQYIREFDAPAMQSCSPLPSGIGS